VQKKRAKRKLLLPGPSISLGWTCSYQGRSIELVGSQAFCFISNSFLRSIACTILRMYLFITMVSKCVLSDYPTKTYGRSWDPILQNFAGKDTGAIVRILPWCPNAYYRTIQPRLMDGPGIQFYKTSPVKIQGLLCGSRGLNRLRLL
jgi:hypothetical protein